MRKASTIAVFISTSTIRFYFGERGMLNLHLIKKCNVVPTIHVERLWSVVSERSRRHWADKKDKAPVIDVMKAGYMKVIGKRKPPEHAVIVNARYFTKKAEEKIQAVGDVCVLCG